jgi:hypothetical protein
MIYGGEALFPGKPWVLAPVDRREIGKMIEAQLGIVTQELCHGDQIVWPDRYRGLATKLVNGNHCRAELSPELINR